MKTSTPLKISRTSLKRSDSSLVVFFACRIAWEAINTPNDGRRPGVSNHFLRTVSLVRLARLHSLMSATIFCNLWEILAAAARPAPRLPLPIRELTPEVGGPGRHGIARILCAGNAQAHQCPKLVATVCKGVLEVGHHGSRRWCGEWGRPPAGLLNGGWLRRRLVLVVKGRPHGR